MAAGRFVFPVVMAVFLLFFLGFVLSTPVTPYTARPAPLVPTESLVARQGDSVLIEVTGFYELDGERYVFFSTEEERHEELPIGEVEPQLREGVVVCPIAPSCEIGSAIIGHKVNDTFTAERGWERVALPRIIAEVPKTTIMDDDLPGMQDLNVSALAEEWAASGQSLEVGARWECDGPGIWTCRFTQVSTEENHLEFERELAIGDTFPPNPFLPVGQQGEYEWDVSIQNGSQPDSFALRLDPPAGTWFQLQQALGGPFVAGTYRIESSSDTELQAIHTSALVGDERLVGLPVIFEIKVVEIRRPQASLPSS